MEKYKYIYLYIYGTVSKQCLKKLGRFTTLITILFPFYNREYFATNFGYKLIIIIITVE